MMKKDAAGTVFAVLGLLFVIWAGLIISPIVSDGILYFLENIWDRISRPFDINLCHATPFCVLILVSVYGFAILIYMLQKPRGKKRAEYGSAVWGSREKLPESLTASKEGSKIMTQNISVSLDTKSHKRNLNTLVVGGSGAGKTRSYAKPNVLQCDTSMVILDPKGEILRDTGNVLIEEGYDIKILDLINMEKSHCYNPLAYVENENDVQMLVTNLFKSTNQRGKAGSDPFWDNTAQMLLSALIFYLMERAPMEERNFPMVMEMLRTADAEKEGEKSLLDEMFSRLETYSPDSLAVKYYRSYRTGADKTLKSIQITLAARLEKFNLPTLSGLTSADEMNLGDLGKKKTAVFAVIPDNDTSFNFLVSILYTQLFQQLFRAADKEKDGRLRVPVHFLMDEFANVSLPDDFPKVLSVMRSRGIFVSIIIQNMAQLKALFEKEWESITGNCDEFLYLGGNEQSTHKYVSELLGKQTIDLKTFDVTEGKNGHTGKHYSTAARDLMTPDEVRRLDNGYAILFIRGELPVCDRKYNIMTHKRVHKTPDGGGTPYTYGERTENIPYIEIIEPEELNGIVPVDIEEIFPDIEILAEDEETEE